MHLLALKRSIFAVAFCLLLSTQASADELTEGNILVSSGNTVTEFDIAGNFVQQFIIPPPEAGDPNVIARDVVVETTKRFHVMTFPGTNLATNQAYLSTYDIDSDSWQHNTITGWSLANVTYYGGIGINGSHIFCPDQEVGGGANDGIIRFPLDDLSNPTRYHEDTVGAHFCTIGMNGVLYAMTRGPTPHLTRLNAETMQIIDQISVYRSASVMGIAGDEIGEMFTVDIDNRVNHFDIDGQLLNSIPMGGSTDIAFALDGWFAVGSGGNEFFVAHRSNLSNWMEVDISDYARGGIYDHAFVTFVEDSRCRDATHIGTLGDDVMNIDITGLDRVSIISRAGNDTITITGTPNPDLICYICTGTENDTVVINSNVEVDCELGSGNDSFTCFGSKSVVVYGEGGNDTIIGGKGIDSLFGGSGIDSIEGGKKRDFIFGGSGDDELKGGGGYDVIMGEAGNDVIRGQQGNDILDGGKDDDVIFAGPGSDILLGRNGDDRLDGGDDKDYLFGEKHVDTCNGGTGINLVSGGSGDDALFAEGDRTHYYHGGAGSDALNFSDDTTARMRYIVHAADIMIPQNLWDSFGKQIDLTEFMDRIQPALDRLDEVGVPHPNL